MTQTKYCTVLLTVSSPVMCGWRCSCYKVRKVQEVGRCIRHARSQPYTVMSYFPLEILSTVCWHLEEYGHLRNFRRVFHNFSDIAEPNLFSTLDAGYEEQISQLVNEQLQRLRLLGHVTALAFDARIVGWPPCPDTRRPHYPNSAESDAWYEPRLG